MNFASTPRRALAPGRPIAAPQTPLYPGRFVRGAIPFVFTLMQTPLPATPFLSYSYKLPGGGMASFPFLAAGRGTIYRALFARRPTKLAKNRATRLDCHAHTPALSLSCQRAKCISFVFIALRTLARKHPGVP